MATEWFIYRDEERLGPYTSAQIRTMALSGELQPSDCLWKKGMPAKRAAGRSVKLFPGLVNAPPPVSGQAAADGSFSFDDPRLGHWGLVVAAAAALLVAVGGLTIMVWPQGETSEQPPADEGAGAVGVSSDPAVTPPAEQPPAANPALQNPPAPPPEPTPLQPQIAPRPPSQPPPGVTDDF